MSATTAELAQAIIDALQPFAATEAPAKEKPKKGKKEEVVTEDDHKPMALAGKSKKKDEEPEEEVEAEEVTEYTEGELKKLKIKELRELAISLDYDEDEVKGASKAELIEAIITEQEEGEAEPAEDDEDEDGDEEGSEYADMSLAELKAEAKERGVDGRKMRNFDVDDVIAILEEMDEEEDEDEDGDEEDDEEIYTEDELNDLPLSDLKELAEEYELDIPKRTRRNTIVDMILEAQDEDLDEDEDEDDDEDDE